MNHRIELSNGLTLTCYGVTNGCATIKVLGTGRPVFNAEIAFDNTRWDVRMVAPSDDNEEVRGLEEAVSWLSDKWAALKSVYDLAEAEREKTNTSRAERFTNQWERLAAQNSKEQSITEAEHGA